MKKVEKTSAAATQAAITIHMSYLHVESNVAKQTKASSGSPELRDLLQKPLQPSRWLAGQPAAGRLETRTGRQAWATHLGTSSSSSTDRTVPTARSGVHRSAI
jgi:hypothetical protein